MENARRYKYRKSLFDKASSQLPNWHRGPNDFFVAILHHEKSYKGCAWEDFYWLKIKGTCTVGKLQRFCSANARRRVLIHDGGVMPADKCQIKELAHHHFAWGLIVLDSKIDREDMRSNLGETSSEQQNSRPIKMEKTEDDVRLEPSLYVANVKREESPERVGVSRYVPSVKREEMQEPAGVTQLDPIIKRERELELAEDSEKDSRVQVDYQEWKPFLDIELSTSNNNGLTNTSGSSFVKASSLINMASPWQYANLPPRDLHLTEATTNNRFRTAITRHQLIWQRYAKAVTTTLTDAEQKALETIINQSSSASSRHRYLTSKDQIPITYADGHNFSKSPAPMIRTERGARILEAAVNIRPLEPHESIAAAKIASLKRKFDEELNCAGPSPKRSIR